jgi:hypothetical protein
MGGKLMTHPEHYDRRPAWVRLMVREGAKRQSALIVVYCLAFLAALNLALAGMESGSTSLLGDVALPLCLGGAVLCGAAALWSWLAMRWVDRHGHWE